MWNRGIRQISSKKSLFRDQAGREVIKLEFILSASSQSLRFILSLRMYSTVIKHNNWLLAGVCKQPIIALHFEFENVLKLYNLEA